MKEKWVVEAEQKAKDLAEMLYYEIAYEADKICVDRKWFFEKVAQYMKTESKDKLDGDPVDIDKAIEHYEGTLETLKGIDLEVNE